MKHLTFTVRLFVLLALTAGLASLAHGQATRTWVSGVGDDLNPCSRTAPCKTFAGAISKTAEGGEIDALDPAGYGSVTITKAMTLDGGTGSGWASILTAATNGVTINIAAAGINHPNDAVVTLRNISFIGASQALTPGLNGVNYLRAAQVHVENCIFENFSTSGINMALGSTGTLFVHDSVFDNTGTGIKVTTTSGFATAQIEHSRFNGMTDGVNTTSNSFITVRDSYFSGITGASNGAVRAAAGCAANVINSTFAGNVIGVNAAGGTVRITNNDFFNNTTAISGTAESANNNKFRGNTTDGNVSNVIVVK
jgi:hypothetical protein